VSAIALHGQGTVFDVRDVLLNLPHNRISWAKYELSGGVGAALLHFRLQPHNALAGTDPPPPPPCGWFRPVDVLSVAGVLIRANRPANGGVKKKVLTPRILP